MPTPVSTPDGGTKVYVLVRALMGCFCETFLQDLVNPLNNAMLNLKGDADVNLLYGQSQQQLPSRCLEGIVGSPDLAWLPACQCCGSTSRHCKKSCLPWCTLRKSSTRSPDARQLAIPQPEPCQQGEQVRASCSIRPCPVPTTEHTSST